MDEAGCEMEESPRQREVQFRLAVDHAPDIFVIYDAQRRLQFVNKKGLQFSGKPLEELLGKRDEELFPPEVTAGYVPLLQKALETRSIQMGECTLSLPGREPYHIIVKYVPLLDQEGGVCQILGITCDITTRTHIEQDLKRSQQQYQDLVQSIDGIVWEFDLATGLFAFVSQKAKEITGYPIECWLTEVGFWERSIHPDDRAWATSYCYRATQQKQDHKMEYRMMTADGKIIWLQDIVTVVMKEGEVVRLRGVMFDVTDRKRAEEALHQQIRKEQSLNRVVRTVRQSIDLHTVFSTAVYEIANLLRADRAEIIQYLPEREIWLYVANYRSDAKLPDTLGLEIPDAENKIAAQLKQLKVVRLEKGSLWHDSVSQAFVQTELGAWLLVPLYLDTDAPDVPIQVWGALSLVRSNPASWLDTEVELACTVADQVAIAIQQSELYRQLQAANHKLQHLVTVDGLTQVANRRRFNEYLDQEWHQLKRQSAPIALILCDIDYFKRYNDYYGHQTGDNCLQQVAQAIDRVVKRPGDLVARYGGEEFAVILPNTSLDGAVWLADQIQQEITRLQLPHPDSQVSDHITISMGIAGMTPLPTMPPTHLVSIADRALYLAKAKGRNTYCVWTSDRMQEAKDFPVLTPDAPSLTPNP